MAVTITPQSFGGSPQVSKDGQKLDFTTGQDPTNIEVPNLPVHVVITTDTGSQQNFDITLQKQLTDIDPSALQVAHQGGGSVTNITAPWMFIIRPKLSDFIIDETSSPPLVQFTGGDLTNCEIAVFRYNVA